jgi:hypothetical protein
MNYTQTKQYGKLTKAGKAIADAFAESGDRKELFKSIKRDIRTQKKDTSRRTRLCLWRGMMKVGFGFTDKDLSPIPYTKAHKAVCVASINSGIDRQRECTLDRATVQRVLDSHPALYVLTTSGRRAMELISGNVTRKRSGEVLVQLSKKADNTPVPIEILGDPEVWWAKYKEVKQELKRVSAIALVNKLNTMLKGILPDTCSKRSTHACRSVYLRIFYQFRNESKATLPSVIRKYLNHEGAGAVGHYQHILLADDVGDLFPPWTDKVECGCGSVVKESGMAKHQTTKKHKEWFYNKTLEFIYS